MRQSRSIALAVVLSALLLSSPASAATVLKLGHQGNVSRVDDPFLSARPGEREPTAPPQAAVATAAPARMTIAAALHGLRARGEISAPMLDAALSEVRGTVAMAARLGGPRGAELDGVLENLRTIAAERDLSASRLPALLLTLQRNRAWWSSGPLLSDGQRVEFAGSGLVWEHYAGQGIELQELASFGRANALYTGRHYPEMLRLLDELLPLASDRAGGIAWEYFFAFGAGAPPWTSAMSQATALQALARAYRVTHSNVYLAEAQRALPVLGTAPPQGVSLPTSRGRRFLLYSFAPGEAVINGFLQTLIGLRELAVTGGVSEAQRLFTQGDREAQAELPAYDTGSWSLYEPGQESTLAYHQLVTGFLHTLCAATHAAVYCAVATRFESYLHQPPRLSLLSTHLAASGPLRLRFRLSKISHVGIVLTQGARSLLYTSASFPRGIGAFSLPTLAPGSYAVRLAATDPAGNFSRIVQTLQVGP